MDTPVSEFLIKSHISCKQASISVELPMHNYVGATKLLLERPRLTLKRLGYQLDDYQHHLVQISHSRILSTLMSVGP